MEKVRYNIGENIFLLLTPDKEIVGLITKGDIDEMMFTDEYKGYIVMNLGIAMTDISILRHTQTLFMVG